MNFFQILVNNRNSSSRFNLTTILWGGYSSRNRSGALRIERTLLGAYKVFTSNKLFCVFRIDMPNWEFVIMPNSITDTSNRGRFLFLFGQMPHYASIPRPTVQGIRCEAIYLKVVL